MRALLTVYQDEEAYYRHDPPLCSGHAIEVLPDGAASLTTMTHSPKTNTRLRQLFPGARDAVPSSLSFAVLLHPPNEETTGEDASRDPEMIEFFTTLPSQRDFWLDAFGSRIDFARGEALLADEKIMMKLEREDPVIGVNESKKEEDESDTEEKPPAPADRTVETATDHTAQHESLLDTAHTFAFRTAAMEGVLTPWQTSASPIRIPGSSKMKPAVEVYTVLVGCRLCCYRSKEVAAAAATTTTSMRNLLSAEDTTPSLDVEITGCSSWEAPTSTWLSVGNDNDGLGFQVEVKGSRHSACFTAPTTEAKAQWLQAIQHELDFTHAEKSLGAAEREFTREVTAHLAVTAASLAPGAGDNPTDVSASRTEGSLRVRHHNLGSIWRDRYVVLEGSKLAIYSDPEDADADSNRREGAPSRALEKHELVGVEKWHPTFTSIGRTGSGSLKGTGFRVETSSGVYLECTASSDDDAARWRAAISAATTKETSDAMASRDASLPYIPGARMEGYVKLKDRTTTIKMKPLKQWKTRYCVVMGSHWLVYANQLQAISSGEAPTPVAVYELLGASPVEGDDDKSAGKFWLQVVPDRRVKCKARSSLERKRWLNAVEDELHTQAQTSEDLARSVRDREDKQAAREAVKSKMHEVKSDARRLSALLAAAMQSARDSGEESDALDDYSGAESDQGSSLRQRRRSDYIDGSPESSPMRRNAGEPSFPFDTLDLGKTAEQGAQKSSSMSPMSSFFACFFSCLPLKPDRSTVAPLGIPGYSSSAAACNAHYTCDYYEADSYRGLAD